MDFEQKNKIQCYLPIKVATNAPVTELISNGITDFADISSVSTSNAKIIPAIGALK